MLRIIIEGDSEMRSKVQELASSAGDDVTISDEKGATGLEVVQLILEYGPPAVVLLRQIVDLVEAMNNARKKWSISIKHEE